VSPLPLPAHFEADRVDELRRVDYAQLAETAPEWARRHGVTPAAEDGPRIGLLAVDLQCTFCLPGFELAVPGAVGDVERLCRWIYRHLDRLGRIVVTLDTHTAMQIFHPLFLVDEEGRHPAPMTPIALDEVEAGRWRVDPSAARQSGLDPESGQRHLLHYCRRLAAGGKYQLMVWPYHAMLGGVGHALVPAFEEAVFFHSVARSSPARFETKGRHPLTESYSVLGPEVREGPDGELLVTPNRELFDVLLEFDALVVAGEAKSHCVAWTLEDLLMEIGRRDPALARRVYLLEDGSSPVVVPGVADFSPQAEEAFARFAAAGMHRVRTTDPLESWPDFPG